MKPKVGVVVQAVPSVYASRRDPGYDPALSQEMHSLIRGKKLVILPRSGHMTFVEQRVLFHETVDGFLQPEARHSM